MPRPPKCRRICGSPRTHFFKPAGIPLRELSSITLELDELEAIRLADLEGLYQADAALQMAVSRQTFGNILGSAHRKIAEALVHGYALQIGPTPSCHDEGAPT